MTIEMVRLKLKTPLLVLSYKYKNDNCTIRLIRTILWENFSNDKTKCMLLFTSDED